MLHKVKTIKLTKLQSDYLTNLKNSRKSSKDLSKRSEVILLFSSGSNYKEIMKYTGLSNKPVIKWCLRWHSTSDNLLTLEKSSQVSASSYRKAIRNVLSDAPRSGRPPRITPEQQCKIISLSCQPPDANSAEKGSVWSVRALTREIKYQNIVPVISKTWVGDFLKSDEYKATQSKIMDFS